MRIVLYDLDLEPITIIEVPHWRRLDMPVGTPITLAVYPDLPRGPVEFDVPLPELMRMETVRIHFDHLLRRHPNGHVAQSWIAFTSDVESALRLKAAFLPGQQRALQERERDAFARGFLRAVVEILR